MSAAQMTRPKPNSPLIKEESKEQIKVTTQVNINNNIFEYGQLS